MYSFFLESSADDIVDGVDGNEGVFVLLKHYFLQFVNFQPCHHAVKHFLAFAGVAACTVQQGHAAAQAVIEG